MVEFSAVVIRIAKIVQRKLLIIELPLAKARAANVTAQCEHILI